MTILPLLPEHYPAVYQIYKEGIATGIATLETETPDWEVWDQRFLPECRFVAIIDGEVAAWAAITRFSPRAVYSGVVEDTLYIGAAHKGKGVGLALLNHVVAASEAAGYWTMQAKIFAQNTASIRLHEKAGFRVVGVRERISRRLGIWIDIVLMERRSPLF